MAERCAGSVRAEAIRLYQDGLTGDETGRHLGITQAAVSNWLRDAGIPARRKGPRGRQDVTTDTIKALRAEGLSWRAVAARTGMSDTGARYRVSGRTRRD